MFRFGIHKHRHNLQRLLLRRHGLTTTTTGDGSRSKAEFVDASVLGVLAVSTAALILEGSPTDKYDDCKDYSSVLRRRGASMILNNQNVSSSSSSCESMFQYDGYKTTIPFSRDVDAGSTPDTSSLPAQELTQQQHDQKQNEPFNIKQVYEILEVLGEGAYGMVYQARRKADGVLIALKTMPREYTGKTDFEREVAALQLLSKPPIGPHDHIVKFYDLHRDDKYYYLAMELIEGGELLDHLIDNGPYSEADAASFLRQFAEAMCFIHHTGLTHNDLKPENLMISYSSNPGLDSSEDKAKLKVVDFGCARSHDLSRKDMQLPAQEFAMGCSFLHQAALGNQTQLDQMLQERPSLVNFRDYDRRTALHIAASEGHVDICEYLVSKGARINRSDRWGGFPLDDAHRHHHTSVVNFLREHGAKFGSTSQTVNLITAASEGDENEVKALLDYGNIDIDRGDYDHRTALHLAAGEGRLEVVFMLCAAGADVNVEDRWGNRPMDDARNAKNNSSEIMSLLSKYGAKSTNSTATSSSQRPEHQREKESSMKDLMKNCTPPHVNESFRQKGEQDDTERMTQLPAKEFALGCSVLHQAALGNQFELEKILQEQPSLVNFRDYDRRTALHIAASEGHVDICRYLVAKGAKINRSDRMGGSPLDDAHRHRNPEVVQFLRENGARFGSTSQATNFITAASEGDKEEVKAFLEFGSVDLNEGDYDRRTALHLAAGEGQLEIVEMLCAAGGDVNVEDRWGFRPLDDAKNAKKNSTEIMRVLVKYGANSAALSSMGQEAVIVDDTKEQGTAGKSEKLSQHEDHVIGTIAYSPPELFSKGATSTPASDMWAIGVIMFILLTGSHPFDKFADKTDNEIKDTLLDLSSDEKGLKLLSESAFDDRIEGLSDSCVELMKNLMQPDPERRMTSENFLRHPWTQGLTVSLKTMDNGLRAFWQEKFRSELMKKFGIEEQRRTIADNDLKKMFKGLKPRKNGAIGIEEIITLFSDLGFSEENIHAMFSSIDLDGTGYIHLDEFQAVMNESISSGKHESGPKPGLQVNYLQQRFKSRILKSFAGPSSNISDKTKLREIFNAIDLEGNGFLDLHEIRVVLRSAGEPEDVISRIVASLDLNQDGGVTWDEFLDIMNVDET